MRSQWQITNGCSRSKSELGNSLLDSPGPIKASLCIRSARILEFSKLSRAQRICRKRGPGGKIRRALDGVGEVGRPAQEQAKAIGANASRGLW